MEHDIADHGGAFKVVYRTAYRTYISLLILIDTLLSLLVQLWRNIQCTLLEKRKKVKK